MSLSHRRGYTPPTNVNDDYSQLPLERRVTRLEKKHRKTRRIACAALILALLGFFGLFAFGIPLSVIVSNESGDITTLRAGQTSLAVSIAQIMLELHEANITFTTLQNGTFTWNLVNFGYFGIPGATVWDSVPNTTYTIRSAIIGPFNFTVMDIEGPSRPLAAQGVNSFGLILSNFLPSYSAFGASPAAISPVIFGGNGFNSYALTAHDLRQMDAEVRTFASGGNLANCLDPQYAQCIIGSQPVPGTFPAPSSQYGAILFTTDSAGTFWISFDVYFLSETDTSGGSFSLKGPIQIVTINTV
jgi:hypothetical protein